MIFDLHCHSNCSDGELEVSELISRAEEKQVDVLSITDHDTVAAYKKIEQDNFAKKPEKNRLKLIPGIEFSTQWNGRGIHIVGLNVDYSSAAIEEGSANQLQARKDRAEKISEKLEKAGLKNALEGTLKLLDNENAVLGRPHFARYMVESGFVSNYEQAFKKYLGSGKPCDIKNTWASLDQVVSWIVESGGTAVIAHPHKYKLTRTKLSSLVDDFKQAGGMAMEVLSGPEDKNVTNTLKQLCNEKGLFASLGSDFHNTKTPWCELGMHKSLPKNCQPVWDSF